MERIFSFMESRGLRIVEWYHDDIYNVCIVVTTGNSAHEEHITLMDEEIPMEDLKLMVEHTLRRLAG